MIETYKTWVTSHNLGDHASVAGLLITILGFMFTFLKLWMVGRNSRVLDATVQNVLSNLWKVDTLKELATLIERLRNLNSSVMTAEAMDLAKAFSDYRTSLIRLRESSSSALPEPHSAIQGILTQLSEIENRLVGSALSDVDLTARKRQNILKTTNDCLDDLQVFMQSLQNNMITRK